MGFFNILETFFFISLAITFVLIIMLVYHFKARLTNVENKYDTMFGIMHNMVGELKGIKKEIAMCAVGSAAACSQFGCMRPTPSYENASEECEENDEDENDEENEGEEIDDASENVRDYYDSYNAPHNISYHTINDFDQPFVKIIVSDNEERGISVPESDTIDFSEDIDEISETPVEEEIQETQENQESQTKLITIELSNNLEEVQPEFSTEESLSTTEPTLTHIVINKIDETSANESSDLVKKHDIIDYKKMDVSYLKTLVITRGLATDTKKLKKMELISLLEESDA